MKKIIPIIISVILIISIIAIGYEKIVKKGEENRKIENNTQIKETEGITTTTSLEDEIQTNAIWCGTFQLVWNDMRDNVVKKDIIFDPQEKMAENLNKKDFTEDMISEEYYFKTYGIKSLELKEQIENGIKEKFNQESDILEDFGWSENELDNPDNNDEKRYFFYAMLYRKFEFLKEFDKLENDDFGNKYKDVKYFGIDENTKETVGSQIRVLYYNSKDDFAIIVNTKSNDEVIFCKSPQGKTFNEIYDNMNKESENFTGSSEFKDVDEFKAPNLTFNEKREYTELQGKKFETADPVYDKAIIEKAIQTIKFSLDEKGGEIKSESGIDIRVMSTSIEEKEEKEEKEDK